MMSTSHKLRVLHRELAQSIELSRKRHGIWAKAHHGGDMRERHRTWEAWKEAVRHSTQLSKQIQDVERAANRGASSCSLDLARAVAIWEGGRSADGMFRPYQDSVGVWTIGYGHTNADGSPHVSAQTHALTGLEATTLLLHDLNTFYAPAVRDAMKRFEFKPSQKTFDGFTDFAYNLGPNNFYKGFAIGDALGTHNLHVMAAAMLLYDHAGGQVLADLTRRRHWEAHLIMGGSYGGAG